MTAPAPAEILERLRGRRKQLAELCAAADSLGAAAKLALADSEKFRLACREYLTAQQALLGQIRECLAEIDRLTEAAS